MTPTGLALAGALTAGLGIAALDIVLADAVVVGVLAFFAALLLTLPTVRGRGWLVALAVSLPVTFLEIVGHGDLSAARTVLVAFVAAYAAVALRSALANGQT